MAAARARDALPRAPLRSLVVPLFLVAITLILVPVDHVPRFYQGHSTSYFSTGLNNVVPLDRSWAYGYAGSWLVTVTATFRTGASPPAGCRRRLLALALLPVAASAMLAVANSRVVPPPEQGHVSVNRMSRRHTMGVFLPALRDEDFQRAGVSISPAEFARLGTSRDGREFSLWRDGPTHIRRLMQDRLHLEPRDGGFERACAALMRSALLHHPPDLVRSYVGSTLLTIRPWRWVKVMPREFGFVRPLPEG